MNTRCFIFCACAVVAPAAVRGQSPVELPPQPQNAPTFRSETRAIEVDAVVTDANGRFVRGLERNDFEVFEDGVLQDVRTFTLVDLPVTASTSRDRRDTAADPDVVSNATEGRIYVMLLDSWGVRVPERAYVKLEQMFRLTQQVARRFVDEALGPDDLMAVVHVQDSRTDAQWFTSNKRLLRASIDKLKPDSDIPPGTSPPLPYCDAPKLRNSYQAIETLSERLGSVTGRRKAILWVNGRIPFDPIADCMSDGGVSGVEGSALSFMHRDALRAATRNNVAIYPIDSIGLTADPNINEYPKDRPIKRLAALRLVADDTGGEAIVNTNAFSAAYERIVTANSSYYLLAYHSREEHHDGRFHSITVRVRRPNVTVRARKGYLAPELLKTPQPPVAPGVSAEADAALRSPIASNGLALRVFLAPFRGAGKDASVVIGADVHGLSSLGVAEDRIEVSYLAISAKGETRVSPLIVIPLGTQESGEPPGERGIGYFGRLGLPPGRYEVRMAVHQVGGSTGSVVGHVEVPDFAKDGLMMSGLVLASAENGVQPSLVSDPTLRELLSVDPTLQRRFPASDTLTALVEVYTSARTPSENIRLRASLTGAGGTKVRDEIGTLARAQPGRALFTVRLPLADLQRGRYVLALEAREGRRTVVREVPFVVE